MRRDDWLIHQLPVGMVEDEFLVRFLSIFQEVGDTVVLSDMREYKDAPSVLIGN